MSSHKALERSLVKMTLGAVRDINRVRAEAEQLQLAEVEQQFQIPVSGSATGTATWLQKELDFDVEFFPATGVRDVNFARPSVSVGVVYEPGDSQADNNPPIVSAYVEWTDDAEDRTKHCRLHIGVYAPEQSDPVPYSAVVHLRIQGYGAPPENETDEIG